MSRRLSENQLRIKRVYSPPHPSDGIRVLVDRLWPRGLSKKRAAIDIWDKDVAPSTELRKWFSHDPVRWKEFIRKYQLELKANELAVDELRALAHATPVTLLFGARDVERNEAVILAQVLMDK